MKTPIVDFLTKYKKSKPIRLHMPAHKGMLNGCEMDITEINGADSLFEANGIIDESEKNLSLLYNTNFSVYSTEGSTLCIKTMLALIKEYATAKGEKPLILATRNVHSSFLYGVALLDIQVDWLYAKDLTILSCQIDANSVEEKLLKMKKLPTAIYLTSPDYLGNIAPIEEISKVCSKYNILLIVDNAHGAYLNFLKENIHPINLGADMCCDSAHKTLPTLTGGAYLHLSKKFNYFTKSQVKTTMKIFASTSPSYLILASLDWTNKYLNANKDAYIMCEKQVQDFKNFCDKIGLKLIGQESLKVTIDCKNFGYLGTDMAEILRKENIYVEYSDKDYIVMMFSPFNKSQDFKKIKKVFLRLVKKPSLNYPSFTPLKPKIKMDVKKALFSQNKIVKVDDAKGEILSCANVSCPPAIPLIMSGEEIDQKVIDVMKYYNVEHCCVVKR